MDQVQFGFSYNSPTFYQLTDNYNANMGTQWNNFDYYNTGNPSDFLNSVSDKTQAVTTPYALQTPSRINMGITAFIKRNGFISADIEFSNYAGATYSTGDGTVDFTSDNATIKSNYKNVINYRLGGEYKILTNYRVRAGYSYMADPYRSSQNVDRSMNRISGGFGYRNQKFSIDLALIFSSGNASYVPYSINLNSPIVSISHTNATALVTVGFTL
jgi:long-subunit fatty acid transport protein